MKVSRFWLALFYVLATALAQCVHDHGPHDEAGRSEHQAGCADPRPHVAGHWSPDLTGDQDHCLACQFRAEHHSWHSADTSFVLISVAHRAVDSSPALPQRSSLRNTCRAPPSREAA